MTKRRESIDYQPTALVLAGKPTLEEWLDICRGLGAMAHGHQWWIGDALVYGEERYGHEASQGEAALGIASQTALNYRWVASRIEPSRRRETLTWSHHAEVGRLEPADQDRLLGEAFEHGWGVRELRDQVALRFPQNTAGETTTPPAPPSSLSDAELASITRRLETLQTALESWREKIGEEPLENYVDGGDVDWLIRTLRFVTRGGAR